MQKSNLAKKRVVYTAVFGGYDLVPDVDPSWDCDFICFTDTPELVSAGWKVVFIQLNGESPAQANRRYKILPHKYLANYEFSLYVDGNIQILVDPAPLFLKYLENGVLAIPKHQDRKCAYAEAKLCIVSGRVNREITERQMSRYAEEGFPKMFGMCENGILLRKHNEISVMALMDAWWVEYCCGGLRDQLSLPYLLWKHNVKVAEIDEGPRINRNFFKITLHNERKAKSSLSRLATNINEKRHFNFYFYIASVLVSLVVVARNFLKKFIYHRND